MNYNINENNWEEKKRLEITVGQATNLANENMLLVAKKFDEKLFEERFNFYFDFLWNKQKKKLEWLKTVNRVNSHLVSQKVLDNMHIENMNENDE